jgi:hypothetical protein
MRNRGTMSNQTTKNADNTGLQPRGGGRCVIGAVDNVNGANAVEVPAYVVTRSELLELVKYWEDVFLSRTFFVFKSGQIGSTDLRLAPFAERRVIRITNLLGEDAVNEVQCVMDEFAKSIGLAEWKRFCEYLGPGHLHSARNGRTFKQVKTERMKISKRA